MISDESPGQKVRSFSTCLDEGPVTGRGEIRLKKCIEISRQGPPRALKLKKNFARGGDDVLT